MGTFNFTVLNKGTSLARPPPASAGLTGTHLPPRPRARPPRAPIATRSEVSALPRDSGRMVYREKGRKHHQEGDRPQPAGWERCFCCLVEYSTPLVMLNGKSKTGCFLLGHKLSVTHSGSHTLHLSLPPFPRETCWISGGGKPYHMLSRHPWHPLDTQLCREQCTGSLLLPSQQRSPAAAAGG